MSFRQFLTRLQWRRSSTGTALPSEQVEAWKSDVASSQVGQHAAGAEAQSEPALGARLATSDDSAALDGEGAGRTTLELRSSQIHLEDCSNESVRPTGIAEVTAASQSQPSDAHPPPVKSDAMPAGSDDPNAVAAPIVEPFQGAAQASGTGPMQRFSDRLRGEQGLPAAQTDGAMSSPTSEQPSDAPSEPPPRQTSLSYPVQVVKDPRGRPVAAFRPRVGEILTRAERMSVANVAPVLQQQIQSGGLFGEIAVALGMVDASDLLWALSQQSGRVQERVGPLSGLHPELIVAREPLSAAAEFIRDLRSQLLDGVLNPGSLQRRALAVVSTNVADGKTYLAANLALSLAQLGGRTILVDADLRTPRIHSLFGVPDWIGGFSTVVGGSGLLRDAIVSLRDIPSLHLLAAGPRQLNPMELLQQPASAVLVQTLIREYEHVIVDTPAMEAGADTRVIAPRCGAAMIVARQGHSRMDDVHSLVAQLQKSGVALAGLVMNRH